MKISLHITMRRGLMSICAAAVLGIALRALLMLRCFDFSTGFYTDSGALAWISLILPLLLAALGGWMCACSRRSLDTDSAESTSKKSAPCGAMAAVSGVLLLYSAGTMAVDYVNYLRTGVSRFESVQQSFIHLLFIAACGLFGLAQLAAAGGFFGGGAIFERIPLFYVTSVLWGMANLVMLYVFYAKSSSFVENFLTIAGGASVLLSLLYMCKFLAGVDRRQSLLRLIIFGGLAGVLAVSYDLINLLLYLTGRTYFGAKPLESVLCELGVGLYALTFLLSRYRTDVNSSLDKGLVPPKHFE